MDNIKEELKNKHILSIDYGQKVTGLATYHIGRDPFPLTYGKLIYKDDPTLIKDLISVIDEEFIDILVIGIPYFTDGKESTMTKTIKSFISELEKAINQPVFTVDETLTTFEAEQRMLKDPKYNFKIDPKKIDELCAAIILEQFLKEVSK